MFLSVLLAGCSISSKTIYSDEPVRTEHTQQVVDGSRRYQVSPAVEGTNLNIRLAQEDLCETRDTPVLHRSADIIREAHPSPLAYVLPGIGLLGLGAAVAFGGDYLGIQAGFGPQPPIVYQAAGGVIGAGGLSLIVIGAVQGGRARDRHRDLGEVAGVPVVKSFACNAGPVRAAPVALLLKRDGEIPGVTDDGGAARFSLTDTPMLDIPGQKVAIRLRKTLFNLELSGAEVEQLHRALEQDSTTRASKDLLAQRQAECTRLTGLAEAIAIDAESSEDVESEARSAWERARAGCLDLLTPESQTKIVSVQQAIAKNIAARAQRGCIVALQALEAMKSSSQVGDASDKAQAACEAVPSESNRLAKAQKRVIYLAEQEQRAERAREQAAIQKAKLRLAKMKQKEAEAEEREASRRLMCCDGTPSPSCSCYGSHRGCCSHHGGVCGCE